MNQLVFDGKPLEELLPIKPTNNDLMDMVDITLGQGLSIAYNVMKDNGAENKDKIQALNSVVRVGQFLDQRFKKKEEEKGIDFGDLTIER